MIARFAHRAAKQRGERAPDAPGVDAGEIGARDQRLGRKRAPLIGAQGGIQPSRHPDYSAPIVRCQPGGRELNIARWGMPSRRFSKSDWG